MKNDVLKCVALLSVILLSSCNNTIEDRIENEFEVFVSENFDDPNTIEEVISITLFDTVSLQMMKKYLLLSKKTFEIAMKGNAIRDSLTLIRLESFTVGRGVDLSNDIKAMKLLSNKMMNFEESIEKNNKVNIEWSYLNSETQYVLDSIDLTTPTPLYAYKIKFRTKANDTLKLNEYYCYIDSLSQNFNIYPSEMSMDKITSMDNKYKHIYDIIEGYQRISKESIGVSEKSTKLTTEFLDYIELKKRYK